MIHLTERQIQHRDYLRSPLWKVIRSKAIEFYGNTCAKCGEYGNDVHHLTYERSGGNERLEDLQVLCRECHEATHDVEKKTKKDKSGKTSCTVRALYSMLSEKQKNKLEEKYKAKAFAILYSLSEEGGRARKEALRMVGVNKIDDDYRLCCKVSIMNETTKEFLKHLRLAKEQGLDIKKFRKDYFSR